ESDSPIRRSTSRTASANGPPPGTISSRRDRAPSRSDASTASKTATSLRMPPPTFTTMSTGAAASHEDTRMADGLWLMAMMNTIEHSHQPLAIHHDQLYVARRTARAYTAARLREPGGLDETLQPIEDP